MKMAVTFLLHFYNLKKIIHQWLQPYQKYTPAGF